MKLDLQLLKKIALVSQVEKKSDWIIDSHCPHHMTSDMNKFVNFKSHDGGIVRIGKKDIRNSPSCKKKK